MSNNNRWSSKFNFILAATGAAVGLGAIWKFPYMAGINGGGAFVIVSIAAILLIGVPIMMGEIMLGYLGRANAIDTLDKLAKQYQQSKYWKYLGAWGALSLLLVLSFYSVISGWSLAYIVKLWGGELTGLTHSQIDQVWDNFLANPIELAIWHLIFMLMTMLVVIRGIQRGIESISKIMMPGLFIILILLCIYSISVGDWQQAIKFLFYPDFSKINPNVFIDALGQAAFSLAIGAGCMLVYGSYIPSNTNISYNVIVIASLIILVSLLSGLAIFPLVFSYNLTPSEGHVLMFKVLPIAFSQMPFGTTFGGLFFLCLWFAALTSSISLAEPLTLLLQEYFSLNRFTAAVIVGKIAFLIGAICLLSFNILSDWRIFGLDLFSAIANFATNFILPTGALGFAIFAGWFIPKSVAQDCLKLKCNYMLSLWQMLIKFICPITIIIILFW